LRLGSLAGAACLSHVLLRLPEPRHEPAARDHGALAPGRVSPQLRLARVSGHRA
jgi:hypothetical protein